MKVIDANRERELLNYAYFHLYNLVKHGSRSHLLPLRTAIKQRAVGAEPAEYGVSLGGKLWKFGTLEECVRKATEAGGKVVRRRNSARSFDVLNVNPVDQGPEQSFLAHVDESGNIDVPENDLPVPETTNIEAISSELVRAGYPKATLIYCKGTRPPAEVLLDLHRSFPELPLAAFAAAVLTHCEVPPVSRRAGSRPTPPYKSDEEKEEWYATPAGQLWLKENQVPAIMAHTKKELSCGRNSFATRDEGAA